MYSFDICQKMTSAIREMGLLEGALDRMFNTAVLLAGAMVDSTWRSSGIPYSTSADKF